MRAGQTAASLWQDTPAQDHHTDADMPPVAADGEFERWLSTRIPVVPVQRVSAETSEGGDTD